MPTQSGTPPRRLIMGAGGYAFAVGVLALVGWLLDMPRLTDWKNEGISMFPNTAACAALAGFALMLASELPEQSLAIRILGAVVALVGGMTLVEHLAVVDLGIDRLLLERTWGQLAAVAPMRMGPPASTAFLLLGLGLMGLTGGPPLRRASAVCGMTVLALGMLSCTGHLYGASAMFMLPHLTGIAMQTATAVTALGVGLLATMPEQEPARTLLDRGAAGGLARFAFPLIAVLIVALGALPMVLQTRGLADAPFAAALRTLLELALLTTLLWWAASSVRTHERALRASEAELHQKATQLASFLDTAAIALHRVGPDGIIQWANDAELTTLGYSADEYIGHPIAKFHCDQHVISDILSRLQRGQKLHDYPARMRCKDGSIKHVMIDSSVLWDNGRFVHTQCFTRDVTEERIAEIARVRLAAIVESSEDAIISKDLFGMITSWNAAAERLLGYTAAEAIGQSVTMLIPTERQNEEPAILERIRRAEQIDHYETIRRRKDGSTLHVALTVSPLLDRHGVVIGASKILRDITEQKRVREQQEDLLRFAQTARAEAEAANHAKDEFLAMLGHELRNPLSAVRNSISAASLDDTARPRALEIARRQSDQLGRIVDDLLDVARISSGRIPLRKAEIFLDDVLRRAVDGAHALMEERGHTLTLSLPVESIRLDADATRIEQAVTNVLANAAKYTDPGGKIVFTAERDGSEAVIRVQDNGVGIAAPTLPKVFDLFTQGERSLDRAQGGLGIGLTLVRRIVDLHRGTVEASSAGVGRGTEVTIRLPALPPAPAPVREPAQPAASQSTTPARSTRVLMVEDNPDAAESLGMILEILGHHVRIVHDGLAALDAARTNPPDIMLVDIGLPGMNGYEVAQAIRREPTLQHLILVALTGYGQAEDKAQALAAGFDYHLVKPVDLEALGSLVAQLGDGVRGRETLQ